MESNTKIRPILRDMAVGETKEFPISRMKSVRTQASELGFMFNRHYTTRTDRASRTIIVTREE